MIKKYQYITAIVLLLIFPLSAIGLNFSVHKCEHRGTIQFPFFKTSNNNHSDNCCAMDDSKNSRKKQHHSNYHEALKQNEVDACCNSNISEQTNKNLNSCCQSNNEEQIHQDRIKQSIKENNNYENKGSELNYINSLCCSNANVNYAIHFAFLNIDVKNFLFKLSLTSKTFFHDANYVKNYHNYSINDINYPIKELINNIILCIHFTSITGDDSDVPYLFFC